MTTPPGFLLGRCFKGRRNPFLIRSEDVVYLILASNIRDELFHTNYHNEIPKGTTGVLARTVNKGMMHVIGPTSVKAALRRLYPRDHLVRIAHAVYVNPAFITALPDSRETVHILLLEIKGTLEGLAMSRRGETELAAAMRDRLLSMRSQPPPEPEFRPFE